MLTVLWQVNAIHCQAFKYCSYFLFSSHMWSLMKQLRIDRKLSNPQSRRMFTVIVPSNAAWEKAQLNFGKAFNTLQNPQFPQYVRSHIWAVVPIHPGNPWLMDLWFLLTNTFSLGFQHYDATRKARRWLPTKDLWAVGWVDPQKPSSASSYGQRWSQVHSAWRFQVWPLTHFLAFFTSKGKSLSAREDP